jgi:hypothetical protein
MSAMPVAPEHILLQSVLIDAHGRAAGYRIYDDGRYETRPAGAEWASGTPLTPEQLAAVHAAISAAALERLESRYPALRQTDDQATLWMQIVRDGQLHSIAIESPRTIPAIERLSADLVEIFKGQDRK